MENRKPKLLQVHPYHGAQIHLLGNFVPGFHDDLERQDLNHGTVAVTTTKGKNIETSLSLSPCSHRMPDLSLTVAETLLLSGLSKCLISAGRHIGTFLRGLFPNAPQFKR